MIERGKSSPSVSTLYKVSTALEVPITSLFRDESEGSQVVFRKASGRTRVPFPRGLWEGLGGEEFTGRMEPFLLTLESGANSGPFSMDHSGHEFVMCLRGQLEYQVENQVFKLNPGDTLLFAAHQKHRWRNTGSTVSNVVIVLAGFEEGDLAGELHYADEERDASEASE
jgi:quercetin dioxygenase-like cupin family protein